MKTKLLFDEDLLVIQPKVAAAIGLGEAIILQQVHYWILRSNNHIQDLVWVYNSAESWRKQFPFFSRATIQRHLESLESQKLIRSENFNKMKMDRTKWYTIIYENVSKIEILLEKNTIAQIEQPSHQHEQTYSQIEQAVTQNGPTIPEITSEITSKEKEKNEAKASEAKSVIEEWNTKSPKDIPKLRQIPSTRLSRFKRRISEGMSLDAIFERVKNSDFLQGKNDRQWVMDFDWLTKNETNWVKVMESKYDNKKDLQFEAFKKAQEAIYQ